MWLACWIHKQVTRIRIKYNSAWQLFALHWESYWRNRDRWIHSSKDKHMEFHHKSDGKRFRKDQNHVKSGLDFRKYWCSRIVSHEPRANKLWRNLRRSFKVLSWSPLYNRWRWSLFWNCMGTQELFGNRTKDCILVCQW